MSTMNKLQIIVTKSDPPALAPDTYPVLKIADNGRIVLFLEKGKGMQLQAPDRGPYYSESWAEYMFSEFHGSIKLTQP